MAELAQRLGLDLPDPLTRDVEFPADFFQRSRSSVVQAEAQAQDLLLSLGQRPEHFLQLLLEERKCSGFRRDGHVLVLDEIAEVRIFLFADRRLQGDGLLRDLDDLAHALDRDVHLRRDLFGQRLSPELLQELAAHADELVDRLDHVHRDPDRPRLVRDRARDRLADPPCRVGGELESLVVVKLLDCLDQAQVSFLDQVEEQHAAADVALRDRDDETQVRLRELALRGVAARHHVREVLLIAAGERVDVFIRKFEGRDLFLLFIGELRAAAS